MDIEKQNKLDVFNPAPTLNDGQQDDDDKEEEGNVKDDAIHLVRVASRVFDFIPNAAPRSHSHIHVEEVALGKMVVAVQVKGEWLSRSMVTSHYTSKQTVLNWEQGPSSVMLAFAVHCTQIAVYQGGKIPIF